jgi:nitrate reductase NapE component
MPGRRRRWDPPTNSKAPRMTLRDTRLRTEIIGIVFLKFCVLAILWFAFVHGAHVPVDASVMARHAIVPALGLPVTGEPNGH